MQTRTKRTSSKSKNAARRVFLKERAELANNLHDKRCKLARQYLHVCKEVGQTLIEAKRKVKHGQWGKWVRENLQFEMRTCQDYMAVAKNWHKVVPHLKDNADISLRGALRVIRETPEFPEEETPVPEGFIPLTVLTEQLRAVEPGTCPREIIQQSSCFVVQDGRVYTYNDEIAFSGPCVLDFDHPIVFKAHPFLETLEMFPDEHVKASVEGAHLILYGKSIGDNLLTVSGTIVCSLRGTTPRCPVFCNLHFGECRCSQSIMGINAASLGTMVS